MRRARFVSKEDAIAIAILAAAACVLFAPAFAGYIPDARDFIKFTLPARAAIRDALLHGHVPEWNPRVGLGVPWLGMPVHGVLYPPQLLLLLGPARLLLAPFVVLHCVFAGVGGYLLARSCGCRPATALVSGLVWDVGGYTVSMWGDGEKAISGAWIPWVAVAIVWLGRRDAHETPRWTWLRRCVGTAVALALLAVAGDPFLWFHGVLLGVFVALGIADDRAWSAAKRIALRSACAIGLACLFAAPVLVPALHVLHDSARAEGLAEDAANVWALHPWRACELFAPLPFGSPLQEATYAARDLVRSEFNFAPWAISLYVGIAATLPAIVAGRSRLTAWLGAAIALSVLLALGARTPLADLARHVFPPLGYMRYPEKHVVVALGALALLAARGCERIVRWEARIAWPIAFGAIAAVILFFASPSFLHPTFARALVHTLIAATLTFGALAIARARRRYLWLVPIVLALDLVAAAHPLLRWIDARALASPPPLAEAALRVRAHAPIRVHRPLGFDRVMETLPDEVGALWGLAYVPGLDSATPRHVREAWDALSTDGKALPVFGVQWAVLPEDAVIPGMRVVAHDAGFALVDLPHAPRAYLVGRAQVLEDTQALERIHAPSFDPAHEATIATDAAGARAFVSNEGAGRCAILSYEAERIAVDCEAADDALFVLADAYAEGWSATLDGAPASILRADVALRGVAVKAGKHRLVFAYATPGLRAGLWLLALGVITSLGLAWMTRSNRRGAEGDALNAGAGDASK